MGFSFILHVFHHDHRTCIYYWWLYFHGPPHLIVNTQSSFLLAQGFRHRQVPPLTSVICCGRGEHILTSFDVGGAASDATLTPTSVTLTFNLGMQDWLATSTMMALPTLFQIDNLYPPGSNDHYCFCFLVDPFVDGPTRVDLPRKKLSIMKKLLEKQYKDETISLMCMILLDCGDRNSSDLLKKFDKSKESTWTVADSNISTLYNFRRLLMKIACKLESQQVNDMITYLQEEIGCIESAENDFRTLLQLLVRALQRGIILPHNLDHLKEWLAVLKRDDLIKDVNQFEPNEQFPGNFCCGLAN